MCRASGAQASSTSGHHHNGNLLRKGRPRRNACLQFTRRYPIEQQLQNWALNLVFTSTPQAHRKGPSRPGTYPSPPTQPHNPKRQQPSRSVSPRITKPASILCTACFQRSSFGPVYYAECLHRPSTFQPGQTGQPRHGRRPNRPLFPFPPTPSHQH